LLFTQPYELDDLLVPPSFPGFGLFFLEAFSCRGEDARVVPPATVGEDVRIGELADGRAIPDVWIGERGLEEGVVEVVNVDGLDLLDTLKLC
jgi:hypothetical protein